MRLLSEGATGWRRTSLSSRAAGSQPPSELVPILAAAGMVSGEKRRFSGRCSEALKP